MTLSAGVMFDKLFIRAYNILEISLHRVLIGLATPVGIFKRSTMAKHSYAEPRAVTKNAFDLFLIIDLCLLQYLKQY